MAFSLLSHGSAKNAAGFPASCTLSGLNTLGADLIVITCSDSNDTDTTLSDSRGNTWTLIQNLTPPNLEDLFVYYCVNPLTSASHNFTYPSDGSGNNSAISVAAFSGSKLTLPFDQSNNANSAAGSPTAQPGSITPTQNNELIYSAICAGGAIASINSGFQIIDNISNGGFNLPTATAYLVQGVAAPVNPTWTFGSSGYTCCQVSFKPAAQPGSDWVIHARRRGVR